MPRDDVSLHVFQSVGVRHNVPANVVEEIWEESLRFAHDVISRRQLEGCSLPGLGKFYVKKVRAEKYGEALKQQRNRRNGSVQSPS